MPCCLNCDGRLPHGARQRAQRASAKAQFPDGFPPCPFEHHDAMEAHAHCALERLNCPTDVPWAGPNGGHLEPGVACLVELVAADPAQAGALSEGFSQGSAGYARDTVLAMSPWPFNLESIP
ncbi:uncharacterized protein STAUR_6103 [Stigmatella aurantiaca DW4/3-1]|uniref:Uncharacterized protein n=1 Tax=Stigmatella aurantiaca (strain DW4/3-1) TaxID=378806 RepID=E3FE90_STIAD|nr:uncharacterized protein STAUR_6103 [Stigmatella aurantiaca DW4/3-1]